MSLFYAVFYYTSMATFIYRHFAQMAARVKNCAVRRINYVGVLV